jgi:uncharacterized protein (DUF1778 family)
MEEDHEWEDDTENIGALPSVWNEEEYKHYKEIFLEECVAPQGWWTAGRASAGITEITRGKKSVTDIGKLMDMGHSTVVDGSSWHQFTQKFIVDNATDILSAKVSVCLDKEQNSMASIIERLKAPLKNARAVMPWGGHNVIVTGKHDKYPILIQATTNNIRRGKSSLGVYDIGIEILGHPDAVEAVQNEIESSLDNTQLSQIKWWTQEQHGPVTRDMHLPPNKTVLRPEFYPDLGDPAKYLEEYLAAPESILMLSGPPGTGKTTLLRHLIVDHKLTAHVIYDEALMRNDKVFQSFLFDEDGDVLIIEDADTILSDRERDGNDMMSRFLNVSDGLIKLPNKKLVFTTNLNDFTRVDQALLRPGRCFGVLHTRALNLTEAQAAAKAASLPIPMEKREYTIAELFNQGKGGKVRSMGFGVRH